MTVMIDPKYQSTHMAVSKSAMETMEKMVKQLQAERDMLLEAAKMGLQESEDWVRDQLEGTGMFVDAMKGLEPIRTAIAACTDSTKVLE